jgi:hypothetical protein
MAAALRCWQGRLALVRNGHRARQALSGRLQRLAEKDQDLVVAALKSAIARL